jgi:hypothetical protein
LELSNALISSIQMFVSRKNSICKLDLSSATSSTPQQEIRETVQMNVTFEGRYARVYSTQRYRIKLYKKILKLLYSLTRHKSEIKYEGE